MPLDDLLRRIGSFSWTAPDLLPLAAAVAVALAAWAIGTVAARKAGPGLASWWASKAGERGSGLTDHFGSLVRDGTSFLLVWLALRIGQWPLLASILLGLVAAVSAALFLRSFARGLNFPDWLASLLALAGFAAVLSEAVNGLRSLTEVLAGVNFRLAGRTLNLLSLVQVAIALLLLLAAFRLTRRVLTHSINKTQRLDNVQKVLAQKLAGIALVAAAFFIGIDLVGIDLTALAVFSGAVGLAVGFGLQKTFGNLIAGIILLLDRSIKPGDVISVGNSFGAISKIGVRAVSIVTRDGKEHLIPNENLMTEEVVNWSYTDPQVRIHIPVGVSYDCDLAEAQRLMIEAAKTPARVLQSPAPVVWLKGFGDSSVDHEILVWIADPEAGVGNVQSEVLNAVWSRFKENDIEIPFPQRDIHIRSMPEPPSP